MPGIGVERASEQVTKSLSPEQSARLGELFEQYNAGMVRYAVSRLTRRGQSYAEASVLAEDIVQAMWLRHVREGGKDLLPEVPLSEDETRWRLCARVKQEIFDYYRLRSSSEAPVDWSDAAVCSMLCPLMPQGCVNAAPELPPAVAAMVDRLPEQERRALRMRLDGTPPVRVGEWLGCGEFQADSLIRTALLLLQLQYPELSGPPVAQESLPEQERAALSLLDPERREAVLRLDDLTRRALLLVSGGMSAEKVAADLGMSRRTTVSMIRCLVTLRRAGLLPASDRPYPGCRPAGCLSRQEVVDALRVEVSAMSAGQKVPARRDLAKRFQSGRSLLDEALAVLTAEGLIESRRGSGTYATGARALMAVAA
jgi:DNA-directed RNA polymerase specialized sigma24 family protein